MKRSLLLLTPLFLFPLAADVIRFQEGDLRNLSTDTLLDASYGMDNVMIREDQPTTTGNGNQFFVGREAGNNTLRGLIEYDISALDGLYSSIDSVSLILNIKANGSGGNFNIGLYEYAFPVDESTATWNSPALGDSTPGGSVGTLLSSANAPGGSGPVDVTFANSSAFQSAVNSALSGDGKLRFLVKQDSGGSSDFRRFTADGDGTTADRPELLISFNAIPEPSTALLLISAAMLGFFCRRGV